MFFLPLNEKKSVELCKRENKSLFTGLTYSVQLSKNNNNKLLFKLLKQQFVGRTHVLPNPYLNISYCSIGRTLKKYMIFYTLPLTRWNRTHKLWNTCVLPFAIAELGQKCLESSTHMHENTGTLKHLHHCTECFNHEDI